jgi:hypothetical protein
MIGLFHGGCGNNNGPGKVAYNLMHGLHKLGVPYVVNQEADLNGCLTAWGPRFMDLPKNTLVGPNLVVVPTDIPQLWYHFKDVLVPCQWVKDMYETFEITENVNIHVWPVGIDTDKFSPGWVSKDNDCLIYFKRGSEETKQELIRLLDVYELSYELITYGSYTEEQLIDVARRSRFCVTITGTESQGIAYQEILSMGVPCYVIDKLVWDDQPPTECPATSVPYFDDRCGIKCPDLSRLEEFIDELFFEQVLAKSNYDPRQYILDNLTLEKCASEYVKLLEMSHNVNES